MAETLDPTALAALLAMVGDDPEFVDELADAFLADLPIQLAALRAAQSGASPADLIRPAHTLKGSSLNLGAMQVAELARAIEERGRAGAIDGVPDLLDGLEAAGAELVLELEQARDRRWGA